jgi:hypothetical protein
LWCNVLQDANDRQTKVTKVLVNGGIEPSASALSVQLPVGEEQALTWSFAFPARDKIGFVTHT